MECLSINLAFEYGQVSVTLWPERRRAHLAPSRYLWLVERKNEFVLPAAQACRIMLDQLRKIFQGGDAADFIARRWG
jgi:hypothetical protein